MYRFFFPMKFLMFTAEKILCVLHGQVFVMQRLQMLSTPPMPTGIAQNKICLKTKLYSAICQTDVSIKAMQDVPTWYG